MTSRRWIAVSVFAAVALAAPVSADQWNERTILNFSAPVMVPGATLPPGSYVFELAESSANRNLVRITSEQTNDVVALTQAVPIKRAEASDDVVLQFNPTERNAAPAIKAWFFPGSEYGHEFVYPEEQARQIAQRTKTVVLAIDVAGSDLEKGVLRTFDAAGTAASWRADAATLREWETWRSAPQPSPSERQRGTAAAISADFRGTRVALNDLEENPTRYLGQRVSVDGEVEEIYGPRLFTIDEPRWGDLGGEILVLLPTPLAALVKENDRVTVSGMVRPFVRTEIEREWGWLGLDPEVEVEVGAKPILVAERLVGGNNDVALVIEATTGSAAPRAVGTSGRTAPHITDAEAVATGGIQMVGQHTRLNGLRVAATPAAEGFFVSVGTRHLFVLPAQPIAVARGDTVTIDGIILQMPRSMVARLNAPSGLNEDLYVYAMNVTP